MEPATETKDRWGATNEQLIHQYYAYFHKHALDALTNLFAPDAVFDYPSRGSRPGDREGFVRFVRAWLTAFPDCDFTIAHIEHRSETTSEVDVVATATHAADLDLKGYGLFKATGAPVTVRFRQLLEIRAGRIVYASFSFDIQDFVRRLVTVDEAQLMRALARIGQVTGELARATTSAERRRDLIDQLGRELDDARRIIRPYYYR